MIITLGVRRERNEGGLSGSGEPDTFGNWFGLDVEDRSGSWLILLETTDGKV